MSARKLLLAAVLGAVAFTGAPAMADTPPTTKPPATKSEPTKKFTLMYRKAGEDKPGRWHRLTGLTSAALKTKQAEYKKKGFDTQVRTERPRKPPK